MKKNKAFKFRLYPTYEQEVFFCKTFGCCRFVYNKMLAERKESYESTGKLTSRGPSELKIEFPFLKEVDSSSLANEWINLNKAYGNFFRDNYFNKMIMNRTIIADIAINIRMSLQKYGAHLE